MFRNAFSFRRKRSDESRLPRFQRSTSRRTESPSSSPSNISEELQENHVGSAASNLEVSADSRGRDSSVHSRKRSEVDSGPLGLNVIYAPEVNHKVDLVFIHGLGGASRRTWSKNEDPELFWPSKFLPFEPDICLTRILTFGYNANFLTAGNISTTVLDFAKDLLFDLKYAQDDQKGDLKIGHVPIIFVVHSMGGLIVKEAYIQGQNDPEYESIIKAISAITFLATPHRGTNLADLLDRILRSTLLTNSRLYISELARNSFTLQKLNEQFRHIAPRLDIVSFYETQSTSIGFKNARIMILEKDSSVLGYPGETSRALNADHHNVCKYDSSRDPNYVIVRNALRSLVSKIILTSASEKPLISTRRQSQDLKSMLAITELPDADYIFFRDQWTQGTNDWLLQEEAYLEWLQAQAPISSLLWLNGGAATGKSVMSSFIIDKLAEQGYSCQYFFINFRDQKKRTLSFVLRSIAYQIARSKPLFLQRILELMDQAINFETADPRTIWERIFKSILFTMEIGQPLYWIIDGLDEAEEPRALIRYLFDIQFSSTPIRLLLVGRKTSELAAVFQKVPETLNSHSINVEGHLEDLTCYIHQELTMSGDAEFRNMIVQRIVDEARNNFLWVRLTVDNLNMCHTQADVELALQQLPVGMEALYDRMASSIAQNPSARDRALASTILHYVTCSLRVLTIAEMSQALQEHSTKMLDFQRSIVDLCGGFVVIDNGGYVSLIHQTAREYLLDGTDHPFYVNKKAAHDQLFSSCMRCLMAVGLRAKITGNQKTEFLEYAAHSWSSHLVLTSLDCGQILNDLERFLTGHWVLVWIQILAVDEQLRVLIRASKHLSKYSDKKSAYDRMRSDQDHHSLRQELIKAWAEDFVKIVGKFGMILRRNPESIHKLIPPFCPQHSAIYQQFGKMKESSISVSGLSNKNWDDSLARMSFGFGTYASSILAAGAHIAVLVSSGSVVLYDSSIFEEAAASPIQHGEHVYQMRMNSTGTLLVTYGYITTKVWEISTGKCKSTIQNTQSRPRPLTMLLTKNDTTLLVGTDDRQIRSLDLNQTSPTWQVVAELEEPELEGHFLNASNHMTLSEDGRLVAVAYRGHPLSAWEVDGPAHIGHCWRKRDEVARGEVIEAVWHPHYPEVLGLYIEGVVFKWRPYDDECDEITTGASRLSISRDGNLFATGDVRGTVKVFTTTDFGLLYQLASQDTVLGLVFSPGLHRFYDIRGYYGNAWEPNALMKFAEQRSIENGSEANSLDRISIGTESSSYRVDAITVLACSPLGHLYCYGTENGTVCLYSTQPGKLADLHVSKGFSSIEQMTWSNDERYLCFSDSSKKVFIMSITSTPGNADPLFEKKAEILVKNNVTGPILQLLFHPDSSQLLVRSSSTICNISLETFSLTKSLARQTAGCQWITHPRDSALILDFGPNTIHIHNWNLDTILAYKYECSPHESAVLNGEHSLGENMVDRVLVTQDKKHVLVQLSPLDKNSREKMFLYFDIASWFTSTAATPSVTEPKSPVSINPIVLPRYISSQIALPLSILSRETLVFLSRTSSICSWRLSFPSDPPPYSAPPISNPRSIGIGAMKSTTVADQPGSKAITLFSLPGDWISRDCLALCSIWNIERSLLCPRNGEVAVVKCSALI